ncbi:MAG: hypothetical protein E7294_02025 [Lachnospiraceae bacterium]|nr:hypothetical protein [Lachnospiraceae bacterium]
MQRDVLLVGGDKRQYYMAKFLERAGFAISCFGAFFPESEGALFQIKTAEKLKELLEKKKYSAVILPTPVGEDYVNGTNYELRTKEFGEWMKGQKAPLVFGGKLPHFLQTGLEKEGKTVVDFMRQEEIARMNGRLTAENAVLEAVLLSDTAVINTRSLVVGFGRCGEMLALVLSGLGSAVSVVETAPEKKMRARTYGYKVEKAEDLSRYQFIFQTVPEKNILSDKRLVTLLGAQINDNCVVIDISSEPDSINTEFARKNGILCVRCPGLPGKYTAKSAGELLGEFVKNHLT